jgi:hypothetical protein
MALEIGCREGANLKAAPDAVAAARNKAVEGIGEEGRNKAEENGDGGPGLG